MPRKRRLPSSDDSDDEFDDLKHPQRNAANARERARMRVLSKAFCRLKTTLPWVPADTKLSKLDTLRLATSYIAHLRAVLMDQPATNEIHKHPLTLTWPFTFQNPHVQETRPDSSTDASSSSYHLAELDLHSGSPQNHDHLPWIHSHMSPDSHHPHVDRDKDLAYYY